MFSPRRSGWRIMPAPTLWKVSRSTRIKLPNSRDSLYGNNASGELVAISTTPISFISKEVAEFSSPLFTSMLWRILVTMAGICVGPEINKYERLGTRASSLSQTRCALKRSLAEISSSTDAIKSPRVISTSGSSTSVTASPSAAVCTFFMSETMVETVAT